MWPYMTIASTPNVLETAEATATTVLFVPLKTVDDG